jgi:hypothetical protein
MIGNELNTGLIAESTVHLSGEFASKRSLIRFPSLPVISANEWFSV